MLNRLICEGDCEYLDNEIHFSGWYHSQIDFQQNILFPLHENVGFGFWMKYQPYCYIKTLSLNKVFEMIDTNSHTISDFSYFLYSITNQIQIRKVQSFLRSRIQMSKQLHKIFYDFQNEKKSISFPFEIDGYEEHWILFCSFFIFLEEITIFGFYYLKQNIIIKSVVINDLPQLGDTIIHQYGGLQYYTNEDGLLIILNQFKGIISGVFSARSVEFGTSVFQCAENTSYDNTVLYCQGENMQFNQLNLELFDDVIFDNDTFQELNPLYQIKGQVRLNQLEEAQLEILLIRITINFGYGDDLYVGDRDLLIKYYQNIDPQMNGFVISTYFYSFPIKGVYQTLDDLQIKVFGAEYQYLQQSGIIFIMRLVLKLKIINKIITYFLDQLLFSCSGLTLFRNSIYVICWW